MFSTDFIFRQQENLVDNQKCQAGFRPVCNKILLAKKATKNRNLMGITRQIYKYSINGNDRHRTTKTLARFEDKLLFGSQKKKLQMQKKSRESVSSKKTQMRIGYPKLRHTLCCKCLGSFPFLKCKMPMFWRAGMREGGKPLPLAFQYLIFMV